MLQQFPNQFPLPDNDRQTAEEETNEMGQIALALLEKSLTEEGTLNLPQRAILAKLYLATIEGKATLAEQIQKDLDLEGRRKANYLTNTLKTFLDSAKTTPRIITATARCPEDRNRQGYYLKVVRATSANEAAPGQSQQITEIKCRIQEKLEDILGQIKSADEEGDILPMEESARQTVLATIESIQQAVEETLSVTSRGFGETNRELLKILLEASERCEAITRPGIAKKIKKPEEAAKDEKEISSILYKLNENLKRSPQTKLALKSQKDRRNRKKFGWYLGLKEEAQTPQSEPKLPASRRKPSGEQKQTLEKLIARAAEQTLRRARREVTILEALKLASRRSLQITPAYCQYVALQLFQTEYPERNFEDKLIRMAEIPEADLGFRITRTSQGTWEAVLSKNEKTLQPLLTEIAGKEKQESKKKPEELALRVRAGLQHLRAQDPEALQKVFDVLIEKYKSNEGLSLAEISAQSGYENKGRLAIWLRRVQKLNKAMPGVLGFNITVGGEEKYRLALTTRYTPAETTFSGRAAPLPVGVKQGINFDRAEFDRFFEDLKTKPKTKQAVYAKHALEILAGYSEKGYAVSSVFLGKLLNDLEKGRHYMDRLKRLLKRLFGGKKAAVILKRYKLGTYYLSTAGTTHTIKPVASPNIQLHKKPKTTEKRTWKAADLETDPELDLDFDESAQPPATLSSLAEAGDLGNITDIGYGPVTLEEEPSRRTSRPKIKTVTADDCKETSISPTTPLEEFQHAITSIAHQYVNGKTTTDALKSLENAVLGLDTKKQPPLITAQKNYLAKVRIAIKRADKDTGLIPDYISTQLFSV